MSSPSHVQVGANAPVTSLRPEHALPTVFILRIEILYTVKHRAVNRATVDPLVALDSANVVADIAAVLVVVLLAQPVPTKSHLIQWVAKRTSITETLRSEHRELSGHEGSALPGDRVRIVHASADEGSFRALDGGARLAGLGLDLSLSLGAELFQRLHELAATLRAPSVKSPGSG